MGLNIDTYPITSRQSDGSFRTLAIRECRHGKFLDGGAAWMGHWQSYGLAAMAADMKSDGRTFATALTHGCSTTCCGSSGTGRRSTPPTRSPNLLARYRATPAGTKSAGMLIPMGYFIGQGYADVVGDEDDIESLAPNTIFSHFSEDASIPESVVVVLHLLRCTAMPF